MNYTTYTLCSLDIVSELKEVNKQIKELSK